MQDLTITTIQTSLHWQNKSANMAMLEEKIWEIENDTDLIILPEMFNTGFSMEAEALGEPMNFHTFKWMKQMAELKKAVICGSYIVNEGKSYYNRLVWMQPDGSYVTYDKRHLFRMANEHQHFAAGETRKIVNIKGWKVCPLVCYDLRFPVWSRNTSLDNQLDFDLLIYIANWPAARINAWDTLLKARAIENLCYSVGVNIVGTDGNEIIYNGHSAVNSPKGEPLYFQENTEDIQTTLLSADNLMSYRKKFPAHRDADSFQAPFLNE